MSVQSTENTFDAAAFLKNLTHLPGVYRMISGDGEILYVGKAKNLKKRVSSYFRKSGHASKTLALMKQVAHVEVTVTHTEAEALILENNLIKEHLPRYNILLRDDKSYPYVYLSSEDEYPRLAFHRGARNLPGRYFGPYPNAGAVRESLNLLQKVFPVRQCEDSFFKNRSRPCLQYQIKRCSAPCVGLIEHDAYMRDVRHAIQFLEGKSTEIADELITQMEDAAKKQDYEQAAVLRDQIRSLKKMQERQYVEGERGNLDVVACYSEGGSACIQVFFIRQGRNLGNKAFFPKIPGQTDCAEILESFIPQYYLDKDIPEEILVNHTTGQTALLQTALSQASGHACHIRSNVRSERKRWVQMATHNARNTLEARLASRQGVQKRLEALQDELGLEQLPARMECFDISHTAGEATVASCVVFDTNGPLKSDYRRFNIKDIIPGDDYAAMSQALTRRYTRLKKGEGKLPDLLVIDGGKGQIHQAEDVLNELQIEGVTIVGIAKGPGRKPGLETLFLSSKAAPIILPETSGALHVLQQIRDEAHRFAISGHRQRRARKRNTSILESIPGMGPKRRQTLIKQFGGMQEIAKAGVEDLASVDGISQQLAQKVYDAFHADKNSQ
jgi:excinuclease ABC subunit C